MNFPAYVPLVVNNYIADVIEGETSTKDDGLLHERKILNQELANIDNLLKSSKSSDELRKRRMDLKKQLDETVERIECLQRLGNDSRMKEVYSLLQSCSLDENQLSGFIHSAWIAKFDLAIHRERFKKATELKKKISKTANQLASLIRDFEDTKIYGSPEFYNIDYLMQKNAIGVKHDEPDDQTLELIDLSESFDDLITYSVNLTDSYDITDEEIYLSNSYILVDGDALDDIDDEIDQNNFYIPALLEKLASIADSCTLSQGSLISASTSKRENNPKTDYIRAFHHLVGELFQDSKIPNKVIEAIATTTSIVITPESVNEITTYADVMRAVTK